MSTSRPLDGQRRLLYEQAVAAFQTALVPGTPAAQYLSDRGIARATAVRHRLGYSGATEPIPGLERFRNHICIPNMALDGHVVGLKFRALDPSADKKYDQPHGNPARAYNVRALHDAGDVLCVTEGEFDTMILGQLGLHSIGFPGNSAFKRHHASLLEGFPRVVLFKDDDDAGDLLEKKIRDLAPEVPLLMVLPPGGKDVNDSFLAGHGDDLVRLAHGR